MKTLSIKSTFMFLIILFISFVMAFFPWKDFGKIFKDTERYIDRIIYLHNGGLEREYSSIGYLFSEPLWKSYLIFSGNFFDNYYYALHILSFIALTIFLNFMYKNASLIIVGLFVINPMFITLIMDQTRMAIAAAILLIAYQSKNKFIVIFLILTSWFIHGFSIVFVIFYFIFTKLEPILKEKKFFIVSSIIAFVLAIFMSQFTDQMLENIGGRRTQYTGNMGSSPLYSFTWFAMSISIILFSKSFLDSRIRIITAYSVLMSSIYFYLSLVGMYGSRFFVVSIPFIVIALSNLQKPFKQITLFFIFLYEILLWSSWLKE